MADETDEVTGHHAIPAGLRASEIRYRRLFESARDGILILDAATRRINDANPFAVELTGYSRDEFLGKELWEIGLFKDGGSGRVAFGELLEKGYVRYVNLPLLTKAGKLRDVEFVSNIYREDGRDVIQCNIRDITEPKRTSERSAERYNLAELAADVGTALVQCDTLRDMLRHCAEAMVRHLDAAFARVWTLNDAEQVLELQASAGMYTHLDGAHSRTPVGQFIVGLIARDRSPHLTNEVPRDPRIGDKEWAERERMVAFAGYPLIVEGRLVGVMAMFARRELTDATLRAMALVANGIAVGVGRMKAAEASRREKEFSENLINSSIDGIFTFDREYRYTTWNPGMQRISGFKREESLGRRAFELFPFLKEIGEDKYFSAALEGRSVVAKDRRYTVPETGQEGFFEGHYSPLRSESGQIIGGLAVIVDVTTRKQMELALRESEGKYRMLLEEASDGIHTYDWDGRFVEVNNKLCGMLGYTRAELLRMRVQDFVPPDELASRPIRFAELRAGRTVISERRLVRKDGTLFPAEISGKMLSDGLLQAIVRDVSERKRAEDRLREAERLAVSTLDALAEHIAVLDEAGTIIATNKAWRDFAAESGGLPEKVCEGANYLAVCERAAARGCGEATLIARGVRAVIRGEAPQFSLEYACRTPPGVLWFVARVTRFHGGGPARFAVAHENITAQKLTEEKLRRSEEWLRSIFEASRDGILIEDAEHINYVNDAYVRLFGYDHPGELINKHVSVVLSAEDEERMLEFGRRRIRGEAAPSAYEFRGKRKDGEALDLEASVSTSAVAGRTYVTTMVRDISERKRADKALREAHDNLEARVAERTEELESSNETLRQEIAEREQAEEARRGLMRRLVAAQEDERRRISRELHDQTGQNLTALSIELKSLEDVASLGPDVRARLQSLREAANNLGHDVHAMAWSLRPSALDDFGLDAALRNYAEDWSRRAGVPVDFQSTGFGRGRLPPAVETTLYRVVQEALTNVFRHARARRVSVILESRRGHARAVIEDDGCGFEAAIITRPPLSRRSMGLLGMRERVQLLDGTIEIESAPGRGTAVFAHVPVPESGEGVSE